MTSGAASLPTPAGSSEALDLPGFNRLRAALRPAELPLPTPRDVREAAGRMNDLLHAERYREVRVLGDAFRGIPAEPEDRLSLLRAALHAASALGAAEEFARDATDLLTELRHAGFPEQADALLTVLLERGPLAQRAAGSAAAALGRADSPRGRRRATVREATPDLVLVVRTVERVGLRGPRGAAVDPRSDAARLRAALAVLPSVRERLLTDPEPALRLRLAQALEGMGDLPGATTAALDALELLEDLDLEDPRADPERLTTAAHAVLARSLADERPLQAVHHALDALDVMTGIEDPPLRIGLITALLQALMSAGAIDEASFAAGRLASLQRTLGRDSLRIAPLLVVATQRVQAERYDAAWVALEQARELAEEQRDRPALLEVARLSASLHERTGEHGASLQELRRMADQARWLADDLDTPTSAQGELIRTELAANSLAMRRALDLGRTDAVEVAVRAIERRTRPGVSCPLLPAELIWDHRVDARVARFLTVGADLVRAASAADGVHASGEAHSGGSRHGGHASLEADEDHLAAEARAGAAAEAMYERRRTEAAEAIAEHPAGHEDRARYWAVYLEDRHAQLLAERGLRKSARKAARRAREGWIELGRTEDAERAELLLEALAGRRAR